MDSSPPPARASQTIDADPALKDKALANLRPGSPHADFAAYRPQLEWLIADRQVGGPARLLLPDPAVRHRRPPRGRRHRPEPHEPLDARRLRPGPLRVPQAAVPRRRPAARRARLRRPPVRGQAQASTTRDLPNPVLHLSSREFCQYAAGVYAANGIHAHILPPDSQRYLATPELSFTIRHLQAHGGLNMSAVAQPARRQRRQVLRRARRPAGAARRPDHGRPRRPGDDDPARCRGPTRCAAARSTSSMTRRTGRTSSCAASRAWSRRRSATRSRSSSRRCTASAR